MGARAVHAMFVVIVSEFAELSRQVDRVDEDEEFAHGANVTTPAILRKTARHGLIRSYCEFATHR